MRVDLRGGDVGVAEQFLHGADVVAVLEQVRGEGMAQRVASGRLGDSRPVHGGPHRLLHRALVEMMPAHHPRPRVQRTARRR